MKQKLIEVYDQNRKRVAVLENAYSVCEIKKLNDVSELTFQLPTVDQKAKYCKQRNFVRYDHGQLYRILDQSVTEEDIGSTEYTCEHAIATLADTLMHRDRVAEGYNTRRVLNYILSNQSDWILGECDFDYQYDYAWTSENLLSALFSVATPFVDTYQFIFQTDSYPWRISLKKLEVEGKPTYYIFAGLNFLRSYKTKKSSQVITRLYCDGAGEGVNQVGIERVNPTGRPYIQAPQAITDQYGIVDGHFCDRSYDDAQALYDAGVALLKKVQVPRDEYEVDVADLKGVTNHTYTDVEVGSILYFAEDDYKTYVTETQQDHDEAGNITITLANTPEDVAGTLADIANRQRIEATYSQGATQIWGSPLCGDAGASTPLTYPLWIPEGTRIVNGVRVKIKLTRFRYNSKSTKSGGASTQTSSADGASTRTSSASGSTTIAAPSATSGSTTTFTQGPSGGIIGGVYVEPNNTTGNDVTLPYRGSTGSPTVGIVTSNTPNVSNSGSAGAGSAAHTHPIGHTHTVPIAHRHDIEHNHEHVHLHKLGVHTHAHPHTHTVPSHSHEIGSHTHTVTTPEHTHSIRIPDHQHDVAYGIFLATDNPQSALIKIGGKDALYMGTEIEADITQYLVDANGQIPRGRFLDISVYPDIFAYVEISVAATGFIQSKQGGKY